MGAAPHMPGASALHAPAITNPSSPALAAPMGMTARDSPAASCSGKAGQ
jgi:hypothetical protein